MIIIPIDIYTFKETSYLDGEYNADLVDCFGLLCEELAELTGCSTHKEWWNKKFTKARNGQTVEGWNENQHRRTQLITLSVINWVYRGDLEQLAMLDRSASSLALWQIDWQYEAMYGFETLIRLIEENWAIPPWAWPGEIVWVDNDHENKLLEVIKDLNAEIKL